MALSRRSTHRILLLFCLLYSLWIPASAEAVSIQFRVRMAHQIEIGAFDPVGEFVDLAGSFNGWGSSPLMPMSDADDDSIYEITVSGFVAGQEIEYKFRQNGLWDGTEEFPGVAGNRRYTVQAGTNEILVWYDDRAPDAGLGELSWWNDTVFYEIFVRSFYDSDGDGIGDFQGLTQKLDYLNDGDPSTTDDLGITGIWLMPIHDSPSYHGYDAVDYRSIHPDYGTLADFQAFLDAAHARGIRVIIDFVMNHSSNQHPWFLAAAQNAPTYRDYYRWSPTAVDETGPWGQTVWHWNPSGYYYGLFWGGMPDLNYESNDLKNEMFGAAQWWLDTIGVDGFRLDAVLYIDEDEGQLESTPATLDFWQEYNAFVKSVAPDMVSVGEAWTSSQIVNRYVIEDRLDFCFEFELAGSILGAAYYGDAGYLGFLAQYVYELYPYLQFGTFLTNHDQNRVMNVLEEDEGKVAVAAGVYLTLPGVPFLYYGEEIGMLGTKPDENIRRPMQWTSGANAGFTTGQPWNAVGSNYVQNNVATELTDPNSLLSHYRALIAARQESAALRRGDLVVLESSNPAVLAFLRRYQNETVLCLANTAPFAIDGLTVTGSAEDLAPGDYSLLGLLPWTTSRPITVSAGHAIGGLELDAHEISVHRLGTSTAVGDPRQGLLPTRIQLRPGSPNPFDASTTIHYALPRATHVRLSVHDLAGREIARLQDGTQEAGEHVATWEGRDERRQPVGAGVYFLRLWAAGESRVQKVVLTR